MNNSVHFSILTIFAIVFVCVYLYYTICDIKKIAVEVKKQGQDIINIVTSLSTITKELSELKKRSGGSCAKPIINVTPQPQVTISTAEVLEDVDDSDSIDTADVKNLLSDIPDEDDVANVDENDDDDVLDADAVAVIETSTVAAKTFKELSPEELKNESYDDLKEYCRSNGLSAKGTKDVLIKRILS